MLREAVMDPDNPNEYRRESHAKKIFFGLMALAMAAATLSLLLKPHRDLSPKGPVPAISAAGWVNGEAPTKQSLDGKVVVICVWATWCAPCRAEAPHLVEIHKRFAGRGVHFVGLTTDGEEQLDKIHRFLKTAGITWPNGWGASETANALGANAIPAVYVVDQLGQLVWFNQEDNGELDEVLEIVLSRSPNRS